MAIEIGCSCESGFGNSGVPDCFSLFGLETGFGLQRRVAADGTANKISINAPIATAFTDLLTEADITKRLYPVTGLQNVDQPQEEVQYENDNQNQKTYLRDGILSYQAEKKEANNVYASKLNQVKCIGGAAKYSFTENGVIGVKSGTDWLPIPIVAFSAQWMPRKGDATEKVMIKYDYELALELGQLWMITYEELGTTPQDLALAGLLDANFTVTTAVAVAATTTISYQLRTDYGKGLVNNQNIAGLVLADYAAVNRTSGLPIVMTAAVELPDVEYQFDMPNQTSADVVRISTVTTSGYEGFVDFTIP